MDFTTIKDMSINNLKIKEIWYNNNILYQDYSGPISYITVTSGDTTQTFQRNYGQEYFELGTVINNSKALPLVKVTIETVQNYFEMGTVTVTTS